jgi:flagellar M-ring protein FliF
MTSGLSYGGSIGPNGVSEEESQYAAHKSKFERDFQRKIASQLSMIPGVIVGVNVELSTELEHRSDTIKLDPKPVTIAARETSKESTSHAPQVSGRPGAVANGVGNQPQTIAAGGGSGGTSTTETQSDIENVPGTEHVHIKSAPLVPKSVTASIEVPSSYFQQVWRLRNPTPAGETPKPPDPADVAKIEVETVNRIKETVRNLLPPVVQGTNPYPHVVVSTYTDLPGPGIAPASLATTTGSWLAENWQTLAVIGVGLASLLMLRSMLRSPAAMPRPASAAAQPNAPRLADDPALDADEIEPGKVLRKRFQSSGPDLRTELQEIVQENPDAAANILRAWIGEAA